jgi:PEGA domain
VPVDAPLPSVKRAHHARRFAFFPCIAHAEKLRITGAPPGAKVEINGVAVGTTPLEKEYPNHSTGRRLAQDSGKKWEISRPAGKFNGARRGQAQLQGGIYDRPIKNGG